MVTPFASAQRDLLDFERIPEDVFASGERIRKASIGIGDEFPRSACSRDFLMKIATCLIRTGHLAMVGSTMRIPVRNFEPMEAYVAEIEGLSGSPVWVRPTDYFNAAQKNGGEEKPFVPFNSDTDVFFLGMLHGRWAISKAAMEGLSAQYAEQMISGMSIIVPAPQDPGSY